MTSVSAISWLDSPSAISFNTSTSRSVSEFPAGAALAGWLNSRISLRAMVGWSEDSPRWTSRIAWMSACDDESLSR